MEITDYLANRVDPQIKWYSSKSRANQKRFKFFRLTNVILSVSIPFLTGIMDDGNKVFLKFTIGIFGLSIAIFESVLNLYKFQENWIEYRSTAENLKHQKYLFETNSGIYTGADAGRLFVENIEGLISKENSVWLGVNQPKPAGPAPQPPGDGQ